MIVGGTMTEYLRTMQLGSATITVIKTFDFLAPIKDWLNVPTDEQSSGDLTSLDGLTRIPAQCFHVALNGKSILIDASCYDAPQDHPMAIPHYQPPPGLLPSLAEVKVTPDEVSHVIITHGHADHFNNVTRQDNGRYISCFPNARYYFGRADWDRMQANLLDPS